MSPAIKLTGVSKNYGHHHAVVDLSLSVPAGAVVGLLGPNGAGKTTTMKMLVGLLSPTTGEISILGQRVSLNPASSLLARIGYLPEEPAFPDGITGGEFIQLVLGLHGHAADGDAVGSHLARFGLEDVGRRRVPAFSRGMRQRLGLAATFSTEPDVVLLDEPVSALDPAGRKEVLDLISSNRGSATVLMSSHILADVERVCDHIAVLHSGRLKFWGTLDECLALDERLEFTIGVRPGQEQAAVAALAVHPWSGRTRIRPSELVVAAVPGLEREIEDSVVHTLVQAGITVTRLTGRRAQLERAFFRIIGQTEDGRGDI